MYNTRFKLSPPGHPHKLSPPMAENSQNFGPCSQNFGPCTSGGNLCFFRRTQNGPQNEAQNGSRVGPTLADPSCCQNCPPKAKLYKGVVIYNLFLHIQHITFFCIFASVFCYFSSFSDAFFACFGLF